MRQHDDRRAGGEAGAGALRARHRGLDGMRALAVLAVVAFHAGAPWLPGGFLGVEAFFVLSGYLITTLLLDRAEGSDRLDLRSFYDRRVRRLLPALLVVGVAVLVAGAGDAPSSLRLDVASTLANVSNWRAVLVGDDYFATTASASPLQHTWSLSVEWQFYLVLPLLVVAALRFRHPRHVILAATLAGAAGSAVLMAVLHDPGGGASRAYFGADTRAQNLLLGAALACVLRSSTATRWATTSVGRRALAAAAVVGVVATAGLWWRVEGTTAFVYEGGFLLAGVATAAVIACVVHHPAGAASRLLELAPLVLLGEISYGIYLWHWPVQLAVTNARTGLTDLPLVLARFVVTVALAAASFWLLEQPLRVRRDPSLATSGRLALASAALVVVALVVVPGPAPDVDVAAAEVSPATPATVGEHAELPAPSETVSAAGEPSMVSPPAPPTTTIPPTPVEPRSVLLLGDSVAKSLADGLATVAPSLGATIDNGATTGCGVASSGAYALSGTESGVHEICTGWAVRWRGQVEQARPDVVVVGLGRHEVLDRTLEGRWTHIGDPDYDAYLAAELETALAIAGSTGARVVVLTSPYFSRPECPDGHPCPEDDPARVDAFNALLRRVAERHGGDVSVVDLGSRVSPDRRYASSIDGVTIRSDGVHLTAAGAQWLAPWLVPQLG